MLIASQKKKENIAEYLLYMWQIEDLIRANHLDVDSIQRTIIDKFDQPDSVKAEMREWYESLIDMMRREGVTEKGHLQLNRNVILDLTDLHLRLLKSGKEPFYTASFYNALPYIVELRSTLKEGEQLGEIETCFSALYGVMLLRLQHKEISEGTLKAVQQIGKLLALLTQMYKQDREKELEL